MHSMSNSANFAELFKKYRLRSQINTLAQFANLLAEEGMVYENSLFSRWQSGERIPRDRKTIVAIVTVFAKNGGIRNIEQANDILQSADQLPLTKTEHTTISSYISTSRPSANELIEYENIQGNIPTQAIDLLNLTVSAMNHTVEMSVEAKALSILGGIGRMLQKIRVNRSVSFLSAFFMVLAAWCLSLNLDGTKSSYSNSYFGLTYAFLPVVAGLFGFTSAYRWGGVKSSMGRALFYLSSGLITWGMGQIMWSYYVLVLQIEIPYPSLADLSFMSSWPLWGIGIYHLSKAAGIKFQLSKKSSQLQIYILPMLMTIFSYYLIVHVARNGVLISSNNGIVVFFDLIYPFMDALLVAEVLLVFGLTFRQLQPRYKYPVLLLFSGILINYIADFAFSYTTANSTYYNGAIADMLFICSLFIMGTAVNSFDVS